jgi:formylglycine-generating enzyme required for sulfatase activity
MWLAAQCGKTDLLRLDTPSALTIRRDWDVNSQGQIFAQFSGPVQFRMGSPDDEPRRDANEVLHQREIGRSFAVSLHEVTIEQYRRFRPEYAPDPQVASSENSPANYVSWTEAAAYCRWLSEQEKVPEDQMCFPPVDQIHESMSLFPDLLSRSGYRLPTEAEWEYVCRGGTESKYLFGVHDEESVYFERHLSNASEVTWPVGTLWPNPFGMFDVQGNVHEWCLDAFGEYPVIGTNVTSTLAETAGLSGTARVCRGASYRSAWRMSRSAFRFQFLPTEKASTIGFRLVKTISDAR